MPNDLEGLQFFTEIGIGVKKGTCHRYPLMLDGGSGVNSTTEELIVQVFNRAAEEGIPLRDKRHPIIRFEKWEQPENLRGVAAGKPVPMVGSVVINVTMLELGKSTGPDVWMRFKVCKAGYTD